MKRALTALAVLTVLLLTACDSESTIQDLATQNQELRQQIEEVTQVNQELQTQTSEIARIVEEIQSNMSEAGLTGGSASGGSAE